MVLQINYVKIFVQFVTKGEYLFLCRSIKIIAVMQTVVLVFNFQLSTLSDFNELHEFVHHKCLEHIVHLMCECLLYTHL